jgi:hypothetical protein
MNRPVLPTARSARDPAERDRLKRLIAREGLVGLANDTKWDELISAMRCREGWRPSYRVRCVDGPVSDWDVEWSYHLPFPMISVLWLDLAFVRLTARPGWPGPAAVDHSPWLLDLLQRIGLDFRAGEKMIRVFGYAPRELEHFDD